MKKDNRLPIDYFCPEWSEAKNSNKHAAEKALYVEGRLLDQIRYYDRGALKNKNVSKWSNILMIFLSCAILCLGAVASILSTENETVRIVIGVSTGLSAILSVLTGYKLGSQAKTLMLQYRSTCESLKQELELFLHKSGDYSVTSDPGRDFVAVCESIMGHEHGNWKRLNETSPKKEGK